MMPSGPRWKKQCAMENKVKKIRILTTAKLGQRSSCLDVQLAMILEMVVKMNKEKHTYVALPLCLQQRFCILASLASS